VSFFGFAGIFEGGFGKTGVLLWRFYGEFVVNCMADVVVEQPYLSRRKIRQLSELYFRVCDGRLPLYLLGWSAC
jgi:hypothetical protein